MVCVPCFIIPVLLFVWHRFIQPILLRYWNPWAVKDKDGNVIGNKVPEFPFQCSGDACPFPISKKQLLEHSLDDGKNVANESNSATDVAPTVEAKKKD